MQIISPACLCFTGGAAQPVVTASISGRHTQLPLAVVLRYHRGFSLELAGKRCVQPAEEEAAGNRSCLEDREEEEDVHSLCCG